MWPHLQAGKEAARPTGHPPEPAGGERVKSGCPLTEEARHLPCSLGGSRETVSESCFISQALKSELFQGFRTKVSNLCEPLGAFGILTQWCGCNHKMAATERAPQDTKWLLLQLDFSDAGKILMLLPKPRFMESALPIEFPVAKAMPAL